MMARRPCCRICRAVLAMWPHVAGVCEVGMRVAKGWRVVMRSES